MWIEREEQYKDNISDRFSLDGVTSAVRTVVLQFRVVLEDRKSSITMSVSIIVRAEARSLTYTGSNLVNYRKSIIAI